jgi:hypothetical protein
VNMTKAWLILHRQLGAWSAVTDGHAPPIGQMPPSVRV